MLRLVESDNAEKTRSSLVSEHLTMWYSISRPRPFVKSFLAAMHSGFASLDASAFRVGYPTLSLLLSKKKANS